ncbi:bifunctional acetate--CoA ligase family protein/GNAT family N-acetyltransferase [Vibrio nitrifigilis]|uniref:Bifunctional acetate--CoA ligase family protein/GNAT family N-acetyltransferase n=1 Tax=Vibrio nitrifigilis TaxID=2789781 RepID=A0ABS0GJQ0_9VIBR|nr:bifunctional acetate--CoA ligase family protein/GNAT family N-acetyltransferase [Vibrio nitrifigilis]MBF9002658.1 bifunctional acetate--CoA ligase family protein/GNAT family N-acetyltransferase [Vibrio nitrifigilis]
MNALTSLLSPQSVAVIGATPTAYRAGNVVMKNLLQNGFTGAIMPVTPKYPSVCGVLAYPSIDSLPIIPTIAIVCTHATRNVDIIRQLADKGVQYAVIVAADMHDKADSVHTIQDLCLSIARQSGMRILGPNSLGLLLPWANFSGAFSPITALPGNVAFISQSAAVCTTVLDWANEKRIGFSAFISLGNACDIDFSELLDCLSTETHTEAILLYVDTINDARRFMSAARAASRNRRILVVKSGRTKRGQMAAHRHNGSDDTLDIIYDSAIRRSGMLRVNNMHELFAAVETLTHTIPLRGERLAIVTNGGGPGIMAVDTLLERGGKLAEIEPELLVKLDSFLPTSWSYDNPIDIVGDAGSERYVESLKVLFDSQQIDAFLLMLSPSAVADAKETAQKIVQLIATDARAKRFNILTNWSGELSVRDARLCFSDAGIPTYRTPESAVGAFMHLVEYRRNQKQLMETPTSTESILSSQLVQAKQWVDRQLRERDCVELDTHQARPLLEAFGFNTLPSGIASDAIEAAHIADQIGYPVAVKLYSPDILHKSNVSGVMLNLRHHNEVASAAQSILDRTELHYPAARIQGLQIQAMAKIADSEELRIVIKPDTTFGPVILIGQGGSEWDEQSDAVAGLPPLNMTLARYMVVRALQERKIRQQKSVSSINVNALSEFLVRLSQLVIECPEIKILDMHPVFINGTNLTLIDMDLTLTRFTGDAQNRLAIRPYPTELIETWSDKKGDTVTIRPILPEDEPQHAKFINLVTKEDLYRRFFTEVGEFNHEDLANMTQIDYDREMAFVAVNGSDIIGVSRALITPENSDAEFAILVRSDLKGRGLGKKLMDKIIKYCINKQVLRVSAITMPNNQGMLTLARNYGFNIEVFFEDGIAEMTLALDKRIPEQK